MQKTRQPEIQIEIEKHFTEIEEEDEHGTMVKRRVIQPPERLDRFIGIASDLFREKEARGCLVRDLSEGELSCLIGITEGVNRATNAKYDEPRDE